MTTTPKIAHVGELASAVAYRMEQHGIMAMPVVDEHERSSASCICTTSAGASRLMRRALVAIGRDAASSRSRPAASTKQPPVVGGPQHRRQRRPGPVRREVRAHDASGIQRGELTADTAYVLDDQNALRPAQSARDLHDRNGRAAGHDGREARRVQHAHADPRRVGRRRRQARRRTHAQVAARHLQPGHAPDLERHHATRSARGSDTQYGIGFTSRPERSRAFTCLPRCGGNFSVLLPEK